MDRRPFEGGWVNASLGMRIRNPFHTMHGPANKQGIVRVAGGRVAQGRDRSWRVALMDYGDPQTDWTGELAFAPVGWESAPRALKGYETFRDHTAFPEDYGKQFALLIDRLGALPQGARLGVQVIKVVPAGVWRVRAARPPVEARRG